ncbi:MAG: TlpA family protein disulfide reductase [Bacteroidetes bacterium]|nr:TlpA family protein disulfide reductase [Bacteroidota bacterium]
MKPSKILLLIALCIIALVGTYFYQKFNTAPTIQLSTLPLKTLDGKNFDINSLKGKKIVFSFGASWCPNCVKELNNLTKNKSNLTDIEIICISDEAIETIIEWKQKKAYPFLFLKLDATFSTYSINAIPTNYIVNKQLEVKASKVGEIDWNDLTVSGQYLKLMN